MNSEHTVRGPTGGLTMTYLIVGIFTVIESDGMKNLESV